MIKLINLMMKFFYSRKKNNCLDQINPLLITFSANYSWLWISLLFSDNWNNTNYKYTYKFFSPTHHLILLLYNII